MGREEDDDAIMGSSKGPHYTMHFRWSGAISSANSVVVNAIPSFLMDHPDQLIEIVLSNFSCTYTGSTATIGVAAVPADSAPHRITLKLDAAWGAKLKNRYQSTQIVSNNGATVVNSTGGSGWEVNIPFRFGGMGSAINSVNNTFTYANAGVITQFSTNGVFVGRFRGLTTLPNLTLSLAAYEFDGSSVLSESISNACFTLEFYVLQ